MGERDEQRMQELFEAAHRDEHVRMQLLQDPEGVAKQWKVDLNGREVDRLKKLGGLVEMTKEAKLGSVFRCDPRVCYPVTVWQKDYILDFLNILVRDIRIVKDNIIFYPAPEIMTRAQDKLEKSLPRR